MKGGGRLLVADLSNLIYRCVHVYSGLSHRGVFTGGVFGVLRHLASAIHHTASTTLAVCDDAPPYWRKQLWLEYKSKRTRETDPAYHQKVEHTRALCRELVGALGVVCLRKQGFEADDCIAYVVRRWHSEFDGVAVFSSDSDLFQLLEYPNVCIYRGGKKGIYTREHFIQEFGQEVCSNWVLFLALAGTHNDVPGIKGVGPVRAAKIISDPVRREKIVSEHREQLEMAISLIHLPHPEFGDLGELGTERSQYSERELIRFMSSLGISYTEQILDSFRQLR